MRNGGGVCLLQRGGGVKGRSYMMVVKLIHDGLEWQESKDETAKAQRYVSEKRLVCVMSWYVLCLR